MYNRGNTNKYKVKHTYVYLMYNFYVIFLETLHVQLDVLF
jgi:hypothetical protein